MHTAHSFQHTTQQHPGLDPQVENYYISAGFLLPTFHKFYWTGLVSNSSTWPKFSWVSALMAAALLFPCHVPCAAADLACASRAGGQPHA